MPRTHVSLITPPGEGAIAVVQLSGADSAEMILKAFRPSRPERFEKRASGRIYHGKIVDGELVIDEVVLAYFSSEESPTGEELFEINCHGGSVAAEGVIERFVALGANRVSWTDLPSSEDALQKEALVALVESTTDLAAKVFLHEWRGCLSDRAYAVLDSAVAADSELEKGKVSAEARLAIKKARTEIMALLETYPFGHSLLHPRQILFAGSPNVGKSSLANAILGRERSIVHDEPGTTRDLVITRTVLRGHSVELIDSAGLVERGKPIELSGVSRTMEALRSAAGIVFVLDASRPLSPNEADFMKRLDVTKTVLVANKIDLPQGLGEEEVKKVFPGKPLRVSALKGVGIEELRKVLEERFSPTRGQCEIDPVIFTERQRDLLARAERELSRSEEALSSHLSASREFARSAVELLEGLIHGEKN